MVSTNSMATRSSLELMLDKIQQLENQPKDIPPALPVRPVSRARLPSSKRPAGGGFGGKRTNKEHFIEPLIHQQGYSAENEGLAASAAMPIREFHHFQNGIEHSSEKSKEIAEKGVFDIQRCYRGYQVRCNYKELRRGVIALQSFVRGVNARRGYHYRIKRLRAVILIQKQTRKYLEYCRLVKKQHAALHSGVRGFCKSGMVTDTHCEDHRIGVPYSALINLQKRVLRTEAKVREKIEEKIALETKLEEINKKWQENEQRMKSMEKTWQDEFTYIQTCLAAAEKNNPPAADSINITSTSPISRLLTPNGGSFGQLDFPVKPIHLRHQHEYLAYDEDCKMQQRQEELGKLKLRFKAWKKEYKHKLREAHSTIKKLGNSETATTTGNVKSPKNWWGRLSS